MIDYGFTVNEYDKCVYSKVLNYTYVILCIYVDDFLIFWTKLEHILHWRIIYQRSWYEGHRRNWFNPWHEYSRIPKGITLSLFHFIEKMLENFDFLKLSALSSNYDSCKCWRMRVNLYIKSCTLSWLDLSLMCQIVQTLIFLMLWINLACFPIILVKHTK